MFDSVTRKERLGAAKLVVVVAIAGAIFSAQAAFFVEAIGNPLVESVCGMRASPGRVPSRDDLPTFGEDIVITAPYRMRLARTDVRAPPWADPDPVALAFNGYCLLTP